MLPAGLDCQLQPGPNRPGRLLRNKHRSNQSKCAQLVKKLGFLQSGRDTSRSKDATGGPGIATRGKHATRNCFGCDCEDGRDGLCGWPLVALARATGRLECREVIREMINEVHKLVTAQELRCKAMQLKLSAFTLA